jgi:hypothetical protein
MYKFVSFPQGKSSATRVRFGKEQRSSNPVVVELTPTFRVDDSRGAAHHPRSASI